MKHFARILKTTGIIKAAPEDQISAVLGKLKSSHDAAFVFDKDKCIGVINPYYCLIQSYNPGKTKVENCLFHPPRINEKDSLERIASLMSESKIHYLPVYNDQEEFIGITSARRILSLMLENADIVNTRIHDVVSGKNGAVISVYEDSILGDAMKLFKEHKVSKLVMIDKNMKLKGILSYYDLIPNLIAPGISRSEGRGRATNKDKQKLMGMKVKDYAKTTTLALSGEHTIGDVIENILKKNKGSVIIVNDESQPIGVMTTKDIFTLLKPQEIPKPVQVISKNTAQQHERVIKGLVDFVQSHIQNDESIASAKVLLEVEKDGALYNIHISLLPVKGKMEVIKREGKDLKSLLTEVKKTLKIVEQGK